MVWTDKRQPKRNTSRVPVPHVEDLLGFATERLRFEPDERQRELLESEAKRLILNCTRQWGKSTVAAIKAVHRAWCRPGSLVLVASPSERQSAEFLRKSFGHGSEAGDCAARRWRDHAISLLFPNGSRIVGLPGTEDTTRGFSAVSLLLVDEAARVEDTAYNALRPSLAMSDGDLWLMSTPYGKRGFFYDTWEHGGAAPGSG